MAALDARFINELKEIVANSRLIAQDLGYDYISTLHFVLADCSTSNYGSLKGFLFENDVAYQSFYESQRIGNATISNDSLPLTVEAENTIRLAWRFRYKYYDRNLHPYHVFIAATQVRKSCFRQMLASTDRIVDHLEDYYINHGLINTININRSPVKRFLARWNPGGV